MFEKRKRGESMSENITAPSMEWEERELLHKQLQLLAEQSKGCVPTELAELSAQMVAIYSVLNPCG